MVIPQYIWQWAGISVLIISMVGCAGKKIQPKTPEAPFIIHNDNDGACEDGLARDDRKELIESGIRGGVHITAERYENAAVHTYKGSGTIIDANLRIITAYHVIRDAEMITVGFRYLSEDGQVKDHTERIPYVVVRHNARHDLALIAPVYPKDAKKRTKPRPIPLNIDKTWHPETSVPSEPVWQFGNMPKLKGYRWVRGCIAAYDIPNGTVPNTITARFTVIAGDSGGPVLNAAGMLVGIIIVRRENSTFVSEDDMGIFVPIYTVIDVLNI